ncbi:MAG TPA: PspC domain-containing protein [Flavobacteriales bacterium]|nr:PspC domain-containing protein [Flavobacteriales bacterium]HIN38829.1 PspC domain-containing protein [Flavobacteriales bacterium]
MIAKILVYFEKFAFGVCAWWGERLGINTSKIRMFFIYLSFITFGSPLVIYLVMAFILEHKSFFKIRKKRNTIWDLE